MLEKNYLASTTRANGSISPQKKVQVVALRKVYARAKNGLHLEKHNRSCLSSALKLIKNNQPSWYHGIDFTVGIVLCGIGSGEAWHGMALLYMPWFLAYLPLEWRHCALRRGIFLHAAVLCIVLQHFSLCRSVFLLAVATSLLPKQKRRKCCAWQQ